MIIIIDAEDNNLFITKQLSRHPVYTYYIHRGMGRRKRKQKGEKVKSYRVSESRYRPIRILLGNYFLSSLSGWFPFRIQLNTIAGGKSKFAIGKGNEQQKRLANRNRGGHKRNEGEPLKVENAFARNCFIVIAEVLGRFALPLLFYISWHHGTDR